MNEREWRQYLDQIDDTYCDENLRLVNSDYDEDCNDDDDNYGDYDYEYDEY